MALSSVILCSAGSGWLACTCLTSVKHTREQYDFNVYRLRVNQLRDKLLTREINGVWGPVAYIRGIKSTDQTQHVSTTEWLHVHGTSSRRIRVSCPSDCAMAFTAVKALVALIGYILSFHTVWRCSQSWALPQLRLCNMSLCACHMEYACAYMHIHAFTRKTTTI